MGIIMPIAIAAPLFEEASYVWLFVEELFVFVLLT